MLVMEERERGRGDRGRGREGGVRRGGRGKERNLPVEVQR